MASSRRFDSKRIEKVRPKSCEIARPKSEWKTSFENRKSVFEQSDPHPLSKKSTSFILLDKQTPCTNRRHKEVSKNCTFIHNSAKKIHLKDQNCFGIHSVSV